MIGEASKRLITGILGASACLAVAGCASSAPKSGYPTFASIPAAPTDVRAPAAWRSSVAGVAAAGAKLNAETAPSTFSLNDTEGFAEATRRKLDAGGAPVTDEAVSRAEADAFSRSIRARATPPPSRR